MTDLELRLSKLEQSQRRLRLACAVLSVSLVGVFTMAAAPAASAGGKLTPSEIVLKGDKRTVTISPHGILIDGPAGIAELDAARLRVSKGGLEGTVEISGDMALIGVMTDTKSGAASSSLRVVTSKSEKDDPSPQLLVTDGKQTTVVLPGTVIK
jgi:hypothetical protein